MQATQHAQCPMLRIPCTLWGLLQLAAAMHMLGCPVVLQPIVVLLQRLPRTSGTS
jgi:hypothetical protein